MNIAELGYPELSKMALSEPSVAVRVPKLIAGALSIMPEYVQSPEPTIEVYDRLSAVVLRDFFTSQLVTELTDVAQRRGFNVENDGRSTTNLPGNTGVSVVNNFRHVIAYGSEPGIRDLFVNKYPAQSDGGPVHVDAGTRKPVVLLGKNPGGTVISNVKITHKRGPSSDEVRRFIEVPHMSTRIDFSDGDVLILKGDDRLHRGMPDMTSRLPRLTVAGYDMLLG